jgi:hypothetical protein
MNNIQTLFEKYAGIAFEKQLAVDDTIGNSNWTVKISEGLIMFDGGYSFPLQVLGTFSHSAQNWLWAWANTQSGLDEKIIENALRLKKYGEENEIDLLTQPNFDFTESELHRFGIIATGMCNASGYYIADYGSGAMLATIYGELPATKSPEVNNEKFTILTTFPRLIATFELDHKNTLTHYLSAKGYSIENDGNFLRAGKGSETITAEFDDLSRLINIKG